MADPRVAWHGDTTTLNQEIEKMRLAEKTYKDANEQIARARQLLTHWKPIADDASDQWRRSLRLINEMTTHPGQVWTPLGTVEWKPLPKSEDLLSDDL